MTSPKGMTFWDHVDELRSVLLRAVVAVGLLTVVAFVFKEELFEVVLAPSSDTFVTYRLMSGLGVDAGRFSVDLINTGLAGQFLIHMKMALWAGIILASPYLLILIFSFVAPALYAGERRYAVRVAGWGYAAFLAGVAMAYFIVFPLTFRFLGTYEVSADVPNLITLASYTDTMTMLAVALGIVFEMPVAAWLLARLGIIPPGAAGRYRRHAAVAILLVAAIITPTSDIFTLMLVAVPMYLLFELSVMIIDRAHH